MKTPTLFIVGLIVGALTVFAIRAASLSQDDPAPSEDDHAAHDGPADPHAGHDMGAQPAPAPAPAPHAPASGDTGAHAHPPADGKLPENEICPVMGNEVDPTIYVDYKGRRIGFCCPPCIEAFEKDPEKFLEIVDAELAARKARK